MAPILENSEDRPIDSDALISQSALPLNPRHPKRKEYSDSLALEPLKKQHRGRVAVAEPESGSINAILREHCRTRLFVTPISWTSEQLRLLESRFNSQGVPPPPQKKADAAPQQAPLENIITLLQGYSCLSFYEHVIEALLAEMGIHHEL